jgi:hypothetical protein
MLSVKENPSVKNIYLNIIYFLLIFFAHLTVIHIRAVFMYKRDSHDLRIVIIFQSEFKQASE